jgi:hypothetical protein
MGKPPFSIPGGPHPMPLNPPRLHRMFLAFAAACVATTGAMTAAEPVNKGASEDRQTLASWGFHEPEPMDFDDHAGYDQIFDGSTLKGWDGDASVWHVEKGAIVGDAGKGLPFNHSYLVYRGAQPSDFDLKLEIMVEKGGGSGIQYRSKTGLPWRGAKPNEQPPNLDWMMTGPQADFWYPVSPITTLFTGQFYSENTPLGIIAWRGQVVVSGPGTKPRLVGSIGDRAALGGYVRDNGWNEYLIMARGGTFIHVINGQLMAVYLDDDPRSSNNQTGFIGIEIEGAPSKVSVRNVWLKKLK